MNSCWLLRNGGTTNRPGRVTLLHGRWLEVAIGPADALLLFRCLIFGDNMSLHALTCSTFLFLRFSNDFTITSRQSIEDTHQTDR